MSQRDDVYLKQLQARYRRASKKEKTVILDEYVKTTGYHRKHATAVLNGRRASHLARSSQQLKTTLGTLRAISRFS